MIKGKKEFSKLLVVMIMLILSSVTFAAPAMHAVNISKSILPAEPSWNDIKQADFDDVLQAIIDAATGPTEIQLTQDITLNGVHLIIPSDKIIKLTSVDAKIYKIDADNKSRVIHNSGTLYLDNVVITGCGIFNCKF